MGGIVYTVVIYPIALIIELAYVFGQMIFKEAGAAVICVSAVISLLCLPLYETAEKWQRVERDTQKRMKGGINRIKAVFKGDERYLILSTYYRQNHYSQST